MSKCMFCGTEDCGTVKTHYINNVEFNRTITCYNREEKLKKSGDIFYNFYLKIVLESEGAKMPTRAKSGDAGLDLYSPREYWVPPLSDVLIPLGWKCEFPEGYVMVVKEKSGIATKDKLDIGASVVDAGYRGIVHVHLFNNHPKTTVIIKSGQKIAQALIYPCWTGTPIEVKELTQSDRGEGGFGSTGV